MFFGQLKKYVGDTKIYVAVNEDDTQISDYIHIIYDDKKQYTERWKEILNKVEEETFMFIHEDMILFDAINYELLEKYITYVNNGSAESIKLILAGDTFIESTIDKTLVTNQYSKFSVQPTITNKKVLRGYIDTLPPLNIWQFEEAVITHGSDYMVRIGGERKRGLYHYDSLIFPYVATAINKGKWNLNEYMDVLNPMFDEYNINPFERGMS
jgi:ABC-type maltose transport system permease subunit